MGLWTKVKVGVAAVVVFAFWVLRGQLTRAKAEAKQQKQRAEVTKAARASENKVVEARQEAQEEAHEAERKHQEHKADGTRPRTFGDSRLRND